MAYWPETNDRTPLSEIQAADRTCFPQGAAEIRIKGHSSIAKKAQVEKTLYSLIETVMDVSLFGHSFANASPINALMLAIIADITLFAWV